MLQPFPQLPFPRFVPTPDLFWHASDLHGQAHVSRVMVHAICLVEATGQQGLAPKVWAAVFLHDLARLHDGLCHRHGGDAAKRLDDEPVLQARLAEAGLTREDYPAIQAAVRAHSAKGEVPRDHEHWPLVALLKDADGLDRVRLGNLDIRYLRHSQSVAMVPFAQRLLDETDDAIEVGETHFEQLWRVVESLSGRRD